MIAIILLSLAFLMIPNQANAKNGMKYVQDMVHNNPGY